MIHGIARSQETAFAVMRIGDVLKNSVAVNELNGSASRKTEMSYVLLGACRDSENLYVVRSVVSKLENDVTEIDVYQLNAVKGKKNRDPYIRSWRHGCYRAKLSHLLGFSCY